MIPFCNMCYDEKPTSYIVENVNSVKMLLCLCDECLVSYSKVAQVKLDGHLHGYHVDDYEQFTDRERVVINRVLESVGLNRKNWEDWRKKKPRPLPSTYKE